MKLSEITYLSEPVPEYQEGLTKAKDYLALTAHLEAWKPLASDASVNGKQFVAFRRGLAKKRRGEYAGDTWASKFATTLMPEVMFRVSMIADQFGVPWGCAYIRCREEGYVHEDDGVAKWVEA